MLIKLINNYNNNVLVVMVVADDGLALLDAKASADAVMTNFP